MLFRSNLVWKRWVSASALKAGTAIEYVWNGNRHVGLIHHEPAANATHVVECIKSNGQAVWVRSSSVLFAFPRETLDGKADILCSSDTSLNGDSDVAADKASVDVGARIEAAQAAVQARSLRKFRMDGHRLAEKVINSKQLYNLLSEHGAFTVDCALALQRQHGGRATQHTETRLLRYAVLSVLVDRYDLFARISSTHFRCRTVSDARLAAAERRLLSSRPRRTRFLAQLYQRLLAPSLGRDPDAGRARNVKRELSAKPGSQSPGPKHLSRASWPKVSDLEHLAHYGLPDAAEPSDSQTQDLLLGLSALRRYALAAHDLDMTEYPLFRFILQPLGYARPFGAKALLNDLRYPLGNMHTAKLALDTDLMHSVDDLVMESVEKAASARSKSDRSPLRLPVLGSSTSSAGGPGGQFGDLDQATREDFPATLRAYAIDSAETTDVDDAVTVEWPAADGRCWVHVHIADPTSFAGAETMMQAVEQTAFRRASTLYLPDGISFMLPHDMRQVFSLDQGQGYGTVPEGARPSLNAAPVRTFTVSIQLDPESGAILDQRLQSLRVPRLVRLTYDEVDGYLRTGQPVPTANPDVDFDELGQLFKLAVARRRHRSAKGAVPIVTQQGDLAVRMADNDTLVTGVSLKREGPAAVLVSEMMVVSAEAVARLAQAHGIPIAFRGQVQPRLDEETAAAMVAELAFGSKDGEPADPGAGSCPGDAAQYDWVLDERDEIARARVVREFRLLRAMESAVTKPEPGPHWALGLDVYSRFSSPLRRYADWVTHAQLKADLFRREPASPPPSLTKSSAAGRHEQSDAKSQRLRVERLTQTLSQFDALAALNRRVQRMSTLYWLARWLSEQTRLDSDRFAGHRGPPESAHDDPSRRHLAVVLDANQRSGRVLLWYIDYGSRGWLPITSVEILEGGVSELGGDLIGGLVLVSKKDVLLSFFPLTGVGL